MSTTDATNPAESKGGVSGAGGSTDGSEQSLQTIQKQLNEQSIINTSFQESLLEIQKSLANLNSSILSQQPIHWQGESKSTAGTTPPPPTSSPPLNSIPGMQNTLNPAAPPFTSTDTQLNVPATNVGTTIQLPVLIPYTVNLPEVLDITGDQLLSYLPERLSSKPNPFSDFIESEQPELKYVSSWPVNTDKTISSTYSTKRSKVVMKNNPSLYPKWEEYMKDILIQCYMTTLTNMHHHLVPKTRDEWEKFDINCRTLRTYKLAQNLIIGHRKVPLVDPEAHIVQQNCVCLVILELLTTANNHLYMTIRDSIDQESLRSLRGRATDQVDFISTRLMYFGVKNHFLQCSVAVNRRRRHEVLRGGRMRPEEQPADWAERLDQAVDLVNRIDKSEQIGPVTKTDIFIEGIQTVTHKLDWTINLIESIDVHQRVSFDEVVQKLQDAYLAAQAKAGGQTYNPLNAVRDAHRKGHRAYLGDVQIHSELPHY